MIAIDIRSGTPIYEQLYNSILEEICAGRLVPDQQLPSVRQLAKELGINPNTIAKVYALLERDGITYTAAGRGSFVSACRPDAVHKKALADFEEAASAALRFGADADELRKRLEDIIRNGGNGNA